MEKGFAAIYIVLIITGLMVVIGLELSTLGFGDASLSKKFAASNAALRAAQSGAEDALVRIARNKSYTCFQVDCYSLDVATVGCATGEACARISVSAGIGTAGDPKIVTSSGSVNNFTRKIQVQVIFDVSQQGRIQSALWSELTN